MPATPDTQGAEHVFTVSELNRTVRDLLETGLGVIWIEGEISNLARPASGHMYFSLKDADAQVRCAMFRNRNRLIDFTPAAGDQVRVRARVSVYEARGDYQLIAEHMEQAGAGSLARAFEALKKRLDAEGLFATGRKRALPALPRAIGVITSPTGAAVRDVIQVLARRFPAIPVIVYPTPVQGTKAASAVVRALERAGQRADCDVLLLVRGGGSLEDLQAFNEEAVARAIVACPIPVVSGVGHEVDVTIADFAADQRAPTPSAAAEMVTPDAIELMQRIRAQCRRVMAAIRRRLSHAGERHRVTIRRLHHEHPERRLQQLQQRRDEIELRLLNAGTRDLSTRRDRLERIRARLRTAAPDRHTARMRDRLAHQHGRLLRAWREHMRLADGRLATLARALNAVSPLATLGRGYALVRRRVDGRPVTDAVQTEHGESLDIQLARGELGVRVEDVHPADH